MKNAASRTVADVMTKTPTTANQDMTLQQAAHLMWVEELACLPVVDDTNACVGILTDRDISMCAYTQGQPLSQLHVALAMAKNVVSVSPDDTLEDVDARMSTHRVRRLPVVDEDRLLLGIITHGTIARETQRASRITQPIAASTPAGPAPELSRIATPKNGSGSSARRS